MFAAPLPRHPDRKQFAQLRTRATRWLGVLAFASAFPQPSPAGAQFVGAQLLVGEGAHRGNNLENIHSLGDTAILASRAAPFPAPARLLFSETARGDISTQRISAN
jgi:hypothetical protein